MIDAILWYVWMQAFGIGGSLLARRWLHNLTDRGYGVGKALGILLGAYVYWMSVTLGWAQNNIGAVLMALAVVWALAIASEKVQSAKLKGERDTSQSERPLSTLHFLLSTEILFAIAFAVCALFRAYAPDIVSAGGEKFMESLMLNAIQRSSTFPPNDAWMSGFAISYYYFGYVMQAMLNIASGIAPSVAFNLSGAMTFALTATSAFSVGVNLWGLYVGRGARTTLVAGLLTAAMLTLMGNMGGIMGALKCVNALPQSVWQWLDVYHTYERSFTCDAGFIPRVDFYSWWWDWARVVKDYLPNGQPWDMITESPIFSFVLGDNHPHVLALPFVLLRWQWHCNMRWGIEIKIKIKLKMEIEKELA